MVHINNTLRKIGLPANVIERQGPLTLNLTELLKQQRQLVLCGNRQLSNGQLANPIHYRPPVPVAGHSVQKSLSQD